MFTYDRIIKLNGELRNAGLFFRLRYKNEKEAGFEPLGSCACAGREEEFYAFVREQMLLEGSLIHVDADGCRLTVRKTKSGKLFDAVLFDLDGTLLPMDQEAFTRGYFSLLLKKLAPLGLDSSLLYQAVWAGTKAMIQNEGEKTNEDLFWEVFSTLTGKKKEETDPLCQSFYREEFKEAKAMTGENPLAKRAIELSHLLAERVALATNPLFPQAGQETRMDFVGIRYSDFDLVTSYETDRFCKPNPAYFKEVCERLSVEPGNCLLVGNDVREDMEAGRAAGLNCILISDCAIYSKELPYRGASMSFAQFTAWMEALLGKDGK